MCGISGYLGKINFINTKKKNVKLTKIMKYRGPDGRGYYINKTKNNFFLGFFHSRLSIIDPSPRSNQPFLDDEGVIIFNGMIYNYEKIRKELQKLGKNFRTNSDTEVLLKFLNKYGPHKLHLLDGMWAFSYYNFKEKKLYVSRDRFGEKPLFYHKNSQNIVFGSNVEYILNIVNKKFEIQKNIIENYLKFGYRSLFSNIGEKTLFKEIKFLQPGRYLEINEKLEVKNRIFWDPKKTNTKKFLSYNNEAKRLSDTYKNIIKERMTSDFPVACLLSGGIDSASIASLVSKLKVKKNFQCFSTYSNDPKYDESKYIKKTIDKYNLKHTYVKVKKNNNKNLKLLSDIIDKTGNIIPTITSLLYSYLCNAIKKKKYKVLLTGVGGDEMFGGYYIHHLHYLKSLQLEKKNKLFLKSFYEWNIHTKKYIRSNHLKNFDNYSKYYNKIDLTSFESLHLKKYFKKYKVKKFTKKRYLKNFFKNELYNEIFSSSLPVQTYLADTIGMYYGLEVRCPILSPKLYELSFSYPNSFLIRNGFSKSIFRDSLKKDVHKNILEQREKIGFFKNIDEFFDFNDKKLLNIMFENKYINSLLNIKNVKMALLNKNKDNQISHLIFGILNCVYYLRKFKQYV